MATKKKATKPATRKASAEDEAAQQGSNRLTGAVYHGGRMYDHRKASDQKAFAALVEKEVKNKESPLDKDGLQRLADAGAIRGFGTKAGGKKARAGEEDSGDSTEPLSEEEAREQAAEAE